MKKVKVKTKKTVKKKTVAKKTISSKDIPKLKDIKDGEKALAFINKIISG